MKRRDFIKGVCMPAVFAAITPRLSAQAQTSSGWQIKPLPFDPKKLKGLSEKLIVSHSR